MTDNELISLCRKFLTEGRKVLPPAQLSIFISLLSYWKENGRSPSLEALAKMNNIRGSSTIPQTLLALEKKGFIEIERDYKGRALGYRPKYRLVVFV